MRCGGVGIGGMRHGRLPFGTKRELLGEDGRVGKWFVEYLLRTAPLKGDGQDLLDDKHTQINIGDCEAGMSLDHEYSLIGGLNRSMIGRWIGSISAIISSVLVFMLLSIVDVAKKFGVDAKIPPSAFSLIGAGIIYGVIYIFFSKYLWRKNLLTKFLKVPDLSGQWECYGKSSFQGENNSQATDWVGIVEISQCWDKISVKIRTTTSRSESVSAALIFEGNSGFRLLYHYKNDPRDFELNIGAHHGLADMIISKELDSASGIYFTGRGRSTHGNMNWRKKS